MTLIETLLAQGVRTLREPRAAAADVLQLGVPREALAPALLLVAVLAVLLDYGLGMAVPDVSLAGSPFRMLFIYVAVTVAFSVTVTIVGRWFGGGGTFEDALLLTVFLQALLIPASALQIGLALVSPGLALIFILLVAVFLFWVQVNFVAALHGFPSLARAFVVTLIVSFVIALLVTPFLAPPAGGLTNV
jgi:hypothetical protein